ncbi:hypothetical protein Bbelb_058690 [Branchiostoma belcheri]|nr:hypothetical protein Bbelb_058690 [Branchiostoma belcheri]
MRPRTSRSDWRRLAGARDTNIMWHFDISVVSAWAELTCALYQAAVLAVPPRQETSPGALISSLTPVRTCDLDKATRGSICRGEHPKITDGTLDLKEGITVDGSIAVITCTSTRREMYRVTGRLYVEAE